VKLMRGIDALEVPEAGAAVTIGTFDGVHVGHRLLISTAVDSARAGGLASVVVTWDRHPFTTLRPQQVPPMLSSLDRRMELLEDTGVEAVALLAFDKELSLWPPERFAIDIIAKKLGGRAVAVGDGWKFGHGAAGDVGLLRRIGEEFGFSVTAVDLSSIAGMPVSSSRIRAAVAAGDMGAAATMLGRPFDVDGRVVRGAGRGKALGFPTANLDIDPALARPARGAYGGRARARGRWYAAAISVGVAPTFGGDESAPVVVEAYLLDFDGELYGETLRVEFWEHLHDDLMFESPDELVAQIEADVRRTREVATPS
jgi:riboflavin kinase / FMN adenylyltransferase